MVLYARAKRVMRVEQDDDVALVFDEALGLFDDHFRDLHVACGGFVEGGGDDFAFDGALHVGDFFGPLVNEQHDEDDFGVVRRDGVGDGLQQHGFAGARRCDDEAALAFADRGEQVHDTATDVVADGLHFDAFVGVERGQVVEENFVAGFFRGFEVDGLDLDEGEVLFAFVRRANVTADGVAGLKVELANLGRRDIDVVGTGEIVVVGRAEKTVAVGEDFEDTLSEDVSLFFALRLEYFEDEVLFAESAGALDVEAARELAEFGDALFFQFGDGHCVLYDEAVFGMGSTGRVVERRMLQAKRCCGGAVCCGTTGAAEARVVQSESSAGDVLCSRG